VTTRLLEPKLVPGKVVHPKLTKVQVTNIEHDRVDLFELQDSCSNHKDSISNIQA